MNTTTREVLAGAYKGGQESRALLTHSLTEGAATSLCGSVNEERLADEYAGDKDSAPTCKRCLKKDPRF